METIYNADLERHADELVSVVKWPKIYEHIRAAIELEQGDGYIARLVAYGDGVARFKAATLASFAERSN